MSPSEYPDVKADYNHVDACCMWMVKNPEYYDVIVTTNMFGDIITDLGGILAGRHGRRGRRQHQSRSGRREHVRADGGQRTEIHRPECHQPHRRDQRHEHAAWSTPASPPPARECMQAIQNVTGTKMKSQAAGKMGYGTTQVGDLVRWAAACKTKELPANAAP